MVHPLVSIVVAVHDSERYLPTCIESILNQTLVNIEIICVDDGSTDKSLEILQDYCQKDPRVTAITQENKGAGAARNLGLERCTGDYLLFLDSDDFFEETMLETMYINAVRFNLDMVICQAFEYDDQTHKTNRILSWAAQGDKIKKEIFSAKDIPDLIFQYVNTWAWNKMIRADLVKNHGLKFQELFSSNDNLFISMALVLAQRIKIISNPLVYYRVNNPNSLQRSKENTWKCSIDSAVAVGNSLISEGLFEKYRRSFINKSLKNIIYYYESVPFNHPSKEIFLRYIKENLVYPIDFLSYSKDYYYDPILFDKLQFILSLEYNNGPIAVVFSSDNNYAKQMYVTAYSILKNKEESTCIDFYLLLEQSFDKKYLEDLEQLSKSFANVEIHYFYMGNRFDEAHLSIEHISTPTYYRLLMADLLPEKYDKCIYLDTDIIVTKDLSEYYSINMGDNYVAGVRAAAYIMNYSSWGYLHSIGIKNIKSYINAGAVLYNLKKIREDNITPVLMSHISKKYSSQDQDIINLVFQGHIITLPLWYNLMTKYESFFDKTLPEYQRVKTIYPDYEINYSVKNPTIIHYAGPVKPWDSEDQILSDVWRSYARECPYDNYTIDADGLSISNEDLNRVLKQLLKKVNSLEVKIESYGSSINAIKKDITKIGSSVRGQSVTVGTFVETLDDLEKIPIKDDVVIRGLRAKSYRDGIGVKKDLVEAAIILQAPDIQKTRWGSQELINVYKGINRSYDLIEGFNYLEKGRIYHNGIGVKKDLDKAAICYSIASHSNTRWATNELFDVLMEIGTTDSYRQMIEIITPYAESGDGGAMGRLARAYRDGKGVEFNLEQARYWMQKAAEQDISWAKPELLDILWRINTDQSRYELISLANEYANSDFGFAMDYLGRAYRLGFGVPVNLPESKRWYEMAIDHGVKWSINGLFDTLWEINTHKSLKEMIALIRPYAESGDGGAMGRLARAYREGKGVKRDIEQAKYWMKKASDLNIPWAKVELKELESL